VPVGLRITGDGHVVEVAGADPRRLQAMADRPGGEARLVPLAGEAFFRDRDQQLPVA